MKKLAAAFLSLAFCFSVQAGAQANGEIRLIIRADDLGSSHAANVACIRAAREGIARSVEVMVPGPWFPEAVRMLNENPGIDVGVHLVLTSEWENCKWRPLTDAPSLVDRNGYFYPMIWPNTAFPPGSFLKEAGWKLEEIERELRAQIATARRLIPGVSHLSYHMGCNDMDPRVKAVVEKLAGEFNVDIEPSAFGVREIPGPGDPKSAEELIEKFGRMLESLAPGSYMFIEHPGIDTPEMQALGFKGYYEAARQRDSVTKLYTSPKIREIILRKGIRLMSYADLKKSGRRASVQKTSAEKR